MQSCSQNRLLALLPEEDLRLLQPDLEQVAWKRGFTFASPDVPQEFTYFPTDGLASVIASTRENQRLEVGIYGRDGMGPTSIVLGVDQTPHRHFVQVEGAAWRMPIDKFTEAIAQSKPLRLLVMRYVYVIMIQTSFTALSNGRSSLGERLARWLLMCNDRLASIDINLTHDFLSLMLGVRRAGVTEALHVLEGLKIISATRGAIRVLDRVRLEETAGGSYGVPEAEYRRLIGPLNRPAR